MRLAAPFLAAALLAAPADAEPPRACPLTYAQFEAAVPHLDLDRCPAALAGPGRFRRATVSQAALHVFVFTTGGAECLQQTRAVPKARFALALM